MPDSPAHNQALSAQSRTVLLATDSQQSVVAEVTGGKTGSIAYTAYGRQSAQQDIATSLGFNGGLRETRVGWYLLGNGYRAYNPTLMRFHSPDSWSPFRGGGLNAYMYCAGDPVNFSDPTGHVRLFPGIPKAVTRPVRKTFDFFFGGSSVTGSRRLPSADQATKQLGGLQGTEGDGVAGAITGAGALIAGAPYPHRGAPRVSSYNYGLQDPIGYVEGAAAGGLTLATIGGPRRASLGGMGIPSSTPSGRRHSMDGGMFREGNNYFTQHTDRFGNVTRRPREPVRGGGGGGGGGDRAIPNAYTPTPIRPTPAPAPPPRRTFPNGARWLNGAHIDNYRPPTLREFAQQQLDAAWIRRNQGR